MTLSADTSTHSRLLARATFDAPTLAGRHPPRFEDRNKRLIHEIACPNGATPAGTLQASRWAAGELPARVPSHEVACEARPGFFDYPAPAVGTFAWHLNFADAHLFYGYSSGLFAQDELQVAEHPILASVRESLLAEPIAGFPALTTEDQRATPVLIVGAERSCAITTRRGNQSIYGNAMHRADEATVRALVTRLEPAPTTNILAIESLPGGRGRYGPDEISRVLMTAAAGFSAAREESHRVAGPDVRVVIHTGHWGCGAYGGNRRLMAIVQLLAARLTRIDRLIFHASDDAYDEAQKHLAGLAPAGTEPALDQVLRNLDELGFEWGYSDGN